MQDHRFVDAFVSLLARMISAARSLEDRIPGCQFLGLITGRENTYFERSFAALGVSDEERRATPSSAAQQSFEKLMREVASSGSLAEMLAVLVSHAHRTIAYVSSSAPSACPHIPAPPSSLLYSSSWSFPCPSPSSTPANLRIPSPTALLPLPPFPLILRPRSDAWLTS